ncbi:MAG: sugar ABC transporter substrate-binding protein [Actinomycetota bacterium]|nr:sugar ABC transporter substrate-binding protein [Actinomycetota bacterium]
MEEAEMPRQSAAVDLAAVKAQVDRFRGIPAFTPPGPAFDATKLRGKTIFEIPITSEVPFIQAVEDGMRQAAAAVGARVVVYPNQGTPSQWAQGIETAIAERADVITLFAQDPSLLGPQIRRAQRAEVPVIVVRTTGEGEPCQRNAAGEIYGTTCVPGPFEQAGRLEAAWVIAASDGRANVLVITSRDARSTASLVRGLRSEFARHCRSCRVRYVDVPIPEWASRLRTEVQSALVGDPKIDYIIPIYDSMSQFVVPAVVAAGAGKRVKIAAFNGTPFVLEMLQRGDIVAMDVGENLAWLGWATVDQAFRVLAGEKPAKSEHTPLRVFDDGNVDDAGRPPRFDQGYGDAYINGYKRLWGVAND